MIGYSVLGNVKKVFESIKSSRKNRIVFVSVCAFFIGCAVAVTTIFSVSLATKENGIGGFESPIEPNFSTSFSDSDLSELVDASDLELPSIPAESPLTYETYRVKKGDMIGFIADKYNVTQDTIISVNSIKQSRLIQVGQYLKIPSIPGIIYTVKKDGETPSSIAEKYEVAAEKCALVNSVAVDTSLKAGASIFVPDAELDWVTRQEINGDLFRKPLKSRYWLSSPYGWRDSPFNTGKRSFHSGVDMAASQGTPIYAALDGKVTTTGYSAVYGNYVIITHHSGYKSLYAHMSQITCKRGNFVYTNTMIGRVGSTGQSTGPHLHWTVYKNGKTVNPLSLIN
jgi:murein DD-endopeptidase MepM/ murein hydrolase activator NlpD